MLNLTYQIKKEASPQLLPWKLFTHFIRFNLSVTLYLSILLFLGFTYGHAQDTWTQKADFGGTARGGAAGFSIGGKGYIGTGNTLAGLQKDFWEYDPVTDSWTQKANFGGIVRMDAVGFSIGVKGYMGTGYSFNGPYLKDFWEYDPAFNNWTQKANFAGTARRSAAGFSIGSKGYLGTGANFNVIPYYKNDFWEYDPGADTWTQKANLGATGRAYAVGISIGNKGYIGTGYYSADGNKNDFWEYDPGNDSWTQEADFGGTPRRNATGFSIGSEGYIGTGYDGINFKNDFWLYDPVTNGWTPKADFGGTPRWDAVGFSIGSRGYIGTGEGYTKDFWEYTPDISSCPVPANLSVTNLTSSSADLNWDAAAGSIGYKIRYKIAGTNTWTNKSSFATSISIGGLSAGNKYTWQVKNLCSSNPSLYSDWSVKQKFTTDAFRIGDELVQQFQMYPNPAKDYTTIQFTLLKPSQLLIKVYDLNGKEILTFLDDTLDTGTYSMHLATSHFSRGVYFVKIISASGMQNQKLIVQ